jgi:hypothetical protein
MGAKNGPVTDRVWNHVSKADGCWNWTGTKNQGGYGVITDGNLNRLAHRVAWESVNGQIPIGLLVRHSCDNPTCCNPTHLLLGTQADNVRDSVERGRRAVGTRNARARFNPETVREIRAKHAEGAPMIALAREHGVAFNSIWQIVHRKTWAHVA